GAGRYQLYVDAIEPDGIGSLYLALEQLKEKMRKAGYFDRPKKAIPAFPRKIAVITSPSGAVIRDIMTTVKRRFPLAQIIVFPARVQGQEAVQDLMEAFDLVKVHQNEMDVVI
ncbi:exodeoxyribonuclease VII large subunit, partial [Escherichia coli]